MSKQRDRDEFVAIMTAEGVPLAMIRKLMRHAASLHRIAELQCSSEAANRDRVPCPWRFREDGFCLCRDYGSFEEGNQTHGVIPRINVQKAQHQTRVKRLCQPYGIKPVFQGDPRGPAVKLQVPSGKTNDRGQQGVCVP